MRACTCVREAGGWGRQCTRARAPAGCSSTCETFWRARTSFRAEIAFGRGGVTSQPTIRRRRPSKKKPKPLKMRARLSARKAVLQSVQTTVIHTRAAGTFVRPRRRPSPPRAYPDARTASGERTALNCAAARRGAAPQAPADSPAPRRVDCAFFLARGEGRCARRSCAAPWRPRRRWRAIAAGSAAGAAEGRCRARTGAASAAAARPS